MDRLYEIAVEVYEENGKGKVRGIIIGELEQCNWAWKSWKCWITWIRKRNERKETLINFCRENNYGLLTHDSGTIIRGYTSGKAMRL